MAPPSKVSRPKVSGLANRKIMKTTSTPAHASARYNFWTSDQPSTKPATTYKQIKSVRIYPNALAKERLIQLLKGTSIHIIR